MENKFYINCKYRDEIIIPIIAISPNWEWHCMKDNEKKDSLCLMKDGILAKVRMCETKTIFEFEKEIEEQYQVSPYEFLKRWYKATEMQLSSITMYHIWLKKYEQ